jgi:outer membrane receptor protein involved in Fe transport
VNVGRATTYGATVGLDWLRALDVDRRFEAHAAVTLADGREWDKPGKPSSAIPHMAPVQLRFGADVDWYRWSIAPRLSIVGAQRTDATMLVGDSLRLRTVDGYATVDVNVRRRNLFKNIDWFVTVENALDRRYRTVNLRAYTNPEELIGAPQNPRRLTVGVDLRLK